MYWNGAIGGDCRAEELEGRTSREKCGRLERKASQRVAY
ncbi:hypothetical protein B8V81_2442 [Paenibacillus pasadenensis]|uniref:Uncharacterized protein n=1 Tax=Paenibacillus pasadenensis TaxID=217090 RepID=A0A2N5N0Z7_9BACL|nr:hypothetical protein B8V81_2442 [Paenibacillus pasadenensis]